MRAVIQRVSGCSVRVDGGKETGRIADGLLVYLAVGKNDKDADVKYMAEKIVNLRIFPDENGKMNRSVIETGGGVLVVSQFTLYGDVRGGRRPSYTAAAEPDKALELYKAAVSAISSMGIDTATGEFGAMMDVSYVNVGPVTILVDSEKDF
jgi:D-tyrosyl-tRNA(Tyr) deacylase